MNLRLWLYGALLSLPALALCGVGAYFLAERAPQLVRAEKAELTREYRAVAEAMLDDPSTVGHYGHRQKGWRQSSRLRRDDAMVPWGHIATADGEIVWCGADSGNVAMVTVPRLEPMLGKWLYVGVISVAAVFVLMTSLGVWCFVLYSKSRNDFLAATAHDLTTPLVAIRSLIGRDDESAKLLCERLLRLVGNVTDFLRLGHRRSPVLACFALGEAFDEAYRIFAGDFADEASGPVTVSGERDAVVRADRLLTVQIVWNLLGNALKYAAPHGKVQASFALLGGKVEFAIADCGPGMTAAQRRHAFGRYYRAKTVLESGKGGFGIGLCTAREFARQMGGDLTVVANAPRGLVFKLTLPREVAASVPQTPPAVSARP